MSDATPTKNVTWTCQFSESNEVTVGQVLHFKCSGNPVEFKIDTLGLVAVGQQEHTLRLLSIKNLTPTSAEFDVVSYRVGEHKDIALAITDGTQFVTVDKISWTVKSVIDPKNAQAQQPFGPFGPWYISWPWWFWVALIAVAATVVILSVWQFRKWRTYRRLKEVTEYKEKFEPFDQLQKVLRTLQRRLDILNFSSVPASEKQSSLNAIFDECHLSFRIYLKMELIAPEQSLGRVFAKRLKKQVGAGDKISSDVTLILAEFSRLKNAFKAQDLEHMIHWVQTLSEAIDLGLTRRRESA